LGESPRTFVVSKKNTAAFVHDPPAYSLSNVDGDSNYVRVRVLTPIGVWILGVVRELTDIVAAAAGDPTMAERTWVLITESPEGGWGINGHTNTGSDIAEAARSELAALSDKRRYSRTASSSNDPTNQRVVISKSRDTPILSLIALPPAAVARAVSAIRVSAAADKGHDRHRT
jgi:phenylpyruvate tautomerase PptA (4-oxalocrotonate tautomerase family)